MLKVKQESLFSGIRMKRALFPERVANGSRVRRRGSGDWSCRSAAEPPESKAVSQPFRTGLNSVAPTALGSKCKMPAYAINPLRRGGPACSAIRGGRYPPRRIFDSLGRIFDVLCSYREKAKAKGKMPR